MQKYEYICYDVLQHLDHSPTGRVLESFAPARGDMHSPQATGRALSIHPAYNSSYQQPYIYISSHSS